MSKTEEQRIHAGLYQRRRNRLKRGLPPVAPEDEKPVKVVPHAQQSLREEFAVPSERFWHSRWIEAIAFAHLGDEVAVAGVLRHLYGALPPDETLAAMARNLIRKVNAKGVY